MRAVVPMVLLIFAGGCQCPRLLDCSTCTDKELVVVGGDRRTTCQFGARQTDAGRERTAVTVEYLHIPIPFLRLIAAPKKEPPPYVPQPLPTTPPPPSPPAKLPEPYSVAPPPVATPHALIMQAQMQGISMEQADDFCRLIEELIQQMAK